MYLDGDRDVLLASLEDVITMNGPKPHQPVILRISGLPVQLKSPVTWSKRHEICKPLVDWLFLVRWRFDVTDGERSAHVFLPRLKRMELNSDAIQSVYGLALSPSSTLRLSKELDTAGAFAIVNTQ